MTAFAVASTDPLVNIFALAEAMEIKGGCVYDVTTKGNFSFSGWHMERQTKSLHFTVLPSHTMERAKELVLDLKECVERVKVCIWKDVRDLI